MDEVAENSDALMERYLEGEEISHDEIVAALKDGTNHGGIFPVTCGVATRNLGTNRLLDAIVEDLPSPVKHGGLELPETSRSRPTRTRELFAYVFKTRADPFAGRINLFRVYQGAMTPRHARAQHPHPRQGAHRPAARLRAARRPSHADEFGPGDIGAVAKLKETRAGDWLAERDEPISMPAIKLPAPVMAFAIEPKSKGDEDKVFTALRRLQEEDPTIDLHRDAQTGEQIVAGLSQVHVEVVVDRLHDALRGRGRRSSRRACPTRRPSAARPRRTGATRSSPAAAASSATATSRSSRWSPARASSSSTRSRAA